MTQTGATALLLMKTLIKYAVPNMQCFQCLYEPCLLDDTSLDLYGHLF